MIHCSLPGCCRLRADGFPVKRLLTLNFSCECQTWSFSTFNLKMKLIPEARKTSHKQISPFFFFFGGRKCTSVSFFFRRACCHGDSTKPLCNSSTLTPLDPLFSPVIKEEEEMEEVPSPSSPQHLPPIHPPPFPLRHTFEYPGTSRPLRAHGH